MSETFMPGTATDACTFLRTTLTGRPQDRLWVTVTWAQAADGSIAGPAGEQLALSAPQSLRITHLLRSLHPAILVGINTILSDDPRLTTRLVAGPSPRPVVLDGSLRCPPDARIFSSDRGSHGPGPLIVTWASTAAICADRARDLSAAGAEIVAIADAVEGDGTGTGDAPRHGWLPLDRVLSALSRHGITGVMVEGGGRVLRSFLDASLADMVVVTVTPRAAHGYRPFDSGSVPVTDGVRRRFAVGVDSLIVVGPAGRSGSETTGESPWR